MHISDPRVRIAALVGAIALFVGGLGWYLSMGLWNLPTQDGFQYFAETPGFQATQTTVAGPHTLTFDLEDPKALKGKPLFRSPSGTVTVTRVDNITDQSCRIWFRAEGVLTHKGGDLVTACMPPLEDKGSTILSSLRAEPQDIYHAYYSTYDAALSQKGNEFAVTVFCNERPPDSQRQVDLIFSDLQMVHFEHK